MKKIILGITVLLVSINLVALPATTAINNNNKIVYQELLNSKTPQQLIDNTGLTALDITSALVELKIISQADLDLVKADPTKIASLKISIPNGNAWNIGFKGVQAIAIVVTGVVLIAAIITLGQIPRALPRSFGRIA